MFRSLFIGFLILSALTSKGVDAQIANNNTNIPSDMLLELFSTVMAQFGETASYSADKSDEVLFSHAAPVAGSAKVLFEDFGKELQALCPDRNNVHDFGLQFAGFVAQAGQHIGSEAGFCVSGLSPPGLVYAS